MGPATPTKSWPIFGLGGGANRFLKYEIPPSSTVPLPFLSQPPGNASNRRLEFATAGITDGRLRVSMRAPPPGSMTLRLVSTLGDVVAQRTFAYQESRDESIELDISRLPAGMYVVQAECEGATAERMVAVVR